MADPLDDLRRAWQGLGPPATGAELEAEDERTRASVAWVRTAWQGLEPPPARVPVRARPARVLLRVAAALLFVVSGAAAWKLLEAASPSEPAAVARNGEGAVEPVEPTPMHGAPGHGAPGEEGDEVVIASLAHDHIEMRSGPVRLILFTDPGVSEAAGTEATDD